MTSYLNGRFTARQTRNHPQSARHVFSLTTNPRLPESVEKTERILADGSRPGSAGEPPFYSSGDIQCSV